MKSRDVSVRTNEWTVEFTNDEVKDILLDILRNRPEVAPRGFTESYMYISEDHYNHDTTFTLRLRYHT